MKLVISLLLTAASLPFARAAGDAVNPISYLKSGHGHGGGGLQVFEDDACATYCRGFMGCLVETGCYSYDEMHADDIAGGKKMCETDGFVWCAANLCDVCDGKEGCAWDWEKCYSYNEMNADDIAGGKNMCEADGFVWCAANLCDVCDGKEGCAGDWGVESTCSSPMAQLADRGKNKCEDDGGVWCANLCNVCDGKEGCAWDWGDAHETGCDSNSSDTEDCRTISKNHPDIKTQWCEETSLMALPPTTPNSVILEEHRA